MKVNQYLINSITLKKKSERVLVYAEHASLTACFQYF